MMYVDIKNESQKQRTSVAGKIQAPTLNERLKRIVEKSQVKESLRKLASE
ncbi:hypothetical protein HCB21_04005 [Listeria booriae]|nr:hypothetical protein [Listeria booriae]MBC2158924.1 hypothetical protein [Listeria booriae]